MNAGHGRERVDLRRPGAVAPRADGGRGPSHRGLQHHAAVRHRLQRRRGTLRLQARPRRAPAVGLPGRHARRARGGDLPGQRGGRASAWCRPTVLRDGPFGPGMVQRWIDTDEERELVDVVPARVGRPGLAHRAARPRRRRRPGAARARRRPGRCGAWRRSTSSSTTPTARAGTCSPASTAASTASTTASACTARRSCARCSGAGWASRCSDDVVDGLRRLRKALSPGNKAGLDDTLHEHLTRAEVSALRSRLSKLLDANELPAPGGRWPPIPWPAF